MQSKFNDKINWISFVIFTKVTDFYILPAPSLSFFLLIWAVNCPVAPDDLIDWRPQTRPPSSRSWWSPWPPSSSFPRYTNDMPPHCQQTEQIRTCGFQSSQVQPWDHAYILLPLLLSFFSRWSGFDFYFWSAHLNPDSKFMWNRYS